MVVIGILQIKLCVAQSTAIYFFKKRKLLFVLSGRGNKKRSCFVKKLLCVHKHTVPRKANTTKGLGKQHCLRFRGVCSILYCAI